MSKACFLTVLVLYCAMFTSVEKEIQDYYIKFLQKNKIDFFRIGNSGFKNKRKAALSYGVFENGVPCDKYFPDVIFVIDSKVYIREFGEKGSNTDRKEKQRIRGEHWEVHGNCSYKLLLTLESAKDDLKEIKSF